MSRMIKTSEGWKKTSGNSDQAELDAVKSSLTQYETYTDEKGLTFTKIGNVVNLNWAQNNATYSANQVVCTLPEKFRPSSQIRNYVINGSTTDIVGFFVINASGTVVVQSNINNINIRVGSTYGVAL